MCGVISRVLLVVCVFFFFSSRRRHTRCREVSWARRCVQETGVHGDVPEKRHAVVLFDVQVFIKCRQQFFGTALDGQSGVEAIGVHRGYAVIGLLVHIGYIQNPVSYTHLTLPTILLVQISVVAVQSKKQNL
eukprot:TRINITY_DN27387_c0_g2_i2.p1 TRINITY_DN27387_c0_g2~~TRINITY_DN27387_c0_g2_i2.p1  ORF type:complete len:132 (+),score=50.85 TRINITY_DN27387_c0_g2_i2:72-467(+)